MMVKPWVAPQPESRQETMPAAPQIAAIPAGNGANQIAGIVGSTPTTIPKPMQTLRVSQGVSQGLVVKRVQPVYPEHAKQMRIQGPVLLEATVSKTGDIANVKVLSGDAILARAATDAVRQWKYRPYFLDGEAVDIQTQITVNFKLP
jgi:protein TonB